MVLNKRQRIVVLIAVVLIGATGIYPPWRGTEHSGQISPVAEYGWIFLPPTLPWFLVNMESVKNMADPKLGPHLDRGNWTWEIELSRLLVEWAIVVLVASGLSMVFGQRERD